MPLIKSIVAADGVDISKLYDPTGGKIAPGSNLAKLLSGDNPGQSILNLVFTLIGVFFFFNIVMAGWDYMLSSGDPKKVQGASTRFLNGFIGLILALTAFIIVKIVTSFVGVGETGF